MRSHATPSGPTREKNRTANAGPRQWKIALPTKYEDPGAAARRPSRRTRPSACAAMVESSPSTARGEMADRRRSGAAARESEGVAAPAPMIRCMLDRTDQRILEELQSDGRLTMAEL